MKLLSLNTLGITLVAIGFLVSLGRVLTVSGGAGGGSGDVMQLAHWQLEPGYREAMDDVMGTYNQLPHVKAAGIRITQAAITEKFYAQWLNTHLVAGTAPDINERGMAALTTGVYTAKYFEPIGNYVVQPNPYNAPQYLPENISPELAEFLTNQPWRETFLDGMRGGFDDSLQDYYAVPTSFWGSVKMYINRQMMAATKVVAIEALQQDPQPDWLSQVFDGGYAVRGPELEAWLSSDEAPQTFGQLVLLSEALNEYARQIGDDKLVPIAGSSYSHWMFSGQYNTPVTTKVGPEVDRNGDGSITQFELAESLEKGVWSIRDPRFVAYLEMCRKLCEYFPPGFLALERDQANNRFVLGRAMIIASGAWDANSLFVGSQSHDDPADRFDVLISPFPLPDPEEKWGEYIVGRASEATANGGAPYQVYQRSEHKPWAIDFLQYLTSFEVNERFNKRANWLPVIVGAEPSEQMKPFSVNPIGISGAMRVDLASIGFTLASRYRGMFPQFLTRDITHEFLADQMDAAIDRPYVGIDEVWSKSHTAARDGNRNLERTIAGQDVRKLLLNADDANDKRVSLVTTSVRQNNAQAPVAAWHRVHKDDEDAVPPFTD
ncbi:MAG: hypothetical protein AAF842_01780 [Planctomycetota bacterium]